MISAFTFSCHNDEEIERRLAEIDDDDIRKAEDVLLHDLSSRSQLRP